MITLKVKDLSKSFGSTEVLKKFNIEIEEGNFLVLLGPSGCGKSTLLNIIAGLETIDEGTVFIDDYNVSEVEPKDRNIAMVFQSYALYPSMNVKENMVFGLKQAQTSKEKVDPNKKSFQIWVNCQITVTTIIGAEIGSNILKNILKNPAPSILAALISSFGMET